MSHVPHFDKDSLKRIILIRLLNRKLIIHVSENNKLLKKIAEMNGLSMMYMSKIAGLDDRDMRKIKRPYDIRLAFIERRFCLLLMQRKEWESQILDFVVPNWLRGSRDSDELLTFFNLCIEVAKQLHKIFRKTIDEMNITVAIYQEILRRYNVFQMRKIMQKFFSTEFHKFKNN